MRVAVIGAGIVGIAVAHALLDEGHTVEIVERDGPASGASRGNAGWIAHVDILPLASAKAWRNLPRWLFDPLGPLAIRPAYLPQLVPWLLRFLAASRPARVEQGILALTGLQSLALPAWERRLAALGLGQHLRRRGFLSVWGSAAGFAAARGLIARQRALGLAVETLDAAGVHRLQPALSHGIAAGAFYDAGCNVSDPRLLTEALAEAAIQRQARLTTGQVARIVSTETGVVLHMAAGSTIAADAVVLAAGAWSRALAACCGDAIPLDTERGYNITLPPDRLGLTCPVVFEGEGFVTTPLDTGDRVGGAVEFAGLDAPPNFRRVDAILARLRRFLPDLNASDGVRWMGFRPSIPDSLPVIGPSAQSSKVFYAFGHGHYGLTQAAATAELVAALLSGRPPAIDLHPFRPARFRTRP